MNRVYGNSVSSFVVPHPPHPSMVELYWSSNEGSSQHEKEIKVKQKLITLHVLWGIILDGGSMHYVCA